MVIATDFDREGLIGMETVDMLDVALQDQRVFQR
jgi:hypothetical protein